MHGGKMMDKQLSKEHVLSSEDGEQMFNQNIEIKSKRDVAKLSKSETKRKQSVKLERMKRHDRKKGILYPEDRIKCYWDIFITFVLIFTCIFIPARIAFVKPLEDNHTINFWLILNSVLDLFFFVDMVIVFNSGFYDEYLKIVDDRG